jgi:transketolase
MKMITDEVVKSLEEKTKVIRRHIIRMLCKSKSGHPGGSLSIADILTVLYFYQMNIRPHEPNWPDRDRLVLSKGHAAPALYAVLAERGYFPVEELSTHRQIDSRLQGHPALGYTPGVDMTTGSLGQGLSAAVGMAIAGKLDKRPYRVYAILGDGEIQSGQIWEAAMAAAHYRLDNLTAILDYNQLQIDGPVEKVMGVSPVADKLRSFNWNVMEINGHDIREIIDALERAVKHKGSPTIIIAHTIKGKGVSFMEGKVEYHAKPLSEEECRRALRELS